MSQVGMGWFPKEIAESPDSPPSPWIPGARFRMRKSGQNGGAGSISDTEASYASDASALPAALQIGRRDPPTALSSSWPADLDGGTIDPYSQAVSRVSPQSPVYAECFTASPERIDGTSDVDSSEDSSDDYSEDDPESFVEIESTKTDKDNCELMFEIDEVVDLYRGLSDL